MGRELVRAIHDADDLQLAGGTERDDALQFGKDLGVALSESVAQAAAQADGWIDFTVPAATVSALGALPNTPVKFAIIGTTGLDDASENAIRAAAQRIAIVRSGNFSLGVNVLARLVAQAAAALGPDWDIEIIEAHHRRKIDAPSGTALLLGDAAAEARGKRLEDARLSPYDGITGARPEGRIGFASIRGGGIVGEHDVVFASENEVLKLSHQALDRGIFARGALHAARWAANKPPGLYSMKDVLGF
jgi:4-hydroxy-tetrahydrodipicolinate reductase